MRTVKEELQNGYRDDEGCVGAMIGAVEHYEESGDADAMLMAFDSAARARGCRISDMVRLVETDEDILCIAVWPEARAQLLSDGVAQRVAARGLRRLTAAMNGRTIDLQNGTDLIEVPYAQEFVKALLGYSHGNATEAQTLAAIQVEDVSVLPQFSCQLEQAARKVGMDEAALVELQTRLSQSEDSTPAT